LLLALDFQSRADGVGHRTAASVNVVPECRPLAVEYPAAPLAFASVAVAVGHNEDPISSVWRPHIDGAERNGPGSITSIPQLLHHARKPTLGPRCDVFDDEVGRDDLVDDSEEVV
jgi:hypothetical protein